MPLTLTAVEEVGEAYQISAIAGEPRVEINPELNIVQKLESLIDKHLSVSIPDGILPEEGIAEIQSFLASRGFNYPSSNLDGDILETDRRYFSWVWLDPKKGTLPKRLAKWLKKNYNQILPPQIMADLGAIAKRHSTSCLNYYYQITDKLTFGDAEFGYDRSGGSCWWGNSKYAEKFIKHGGLACLFYNSDQPRVNSNGIGRIWIAPDYDDSKYAMLFNGYWDDGQGASLMLTRVVATILGVTYRKVINATSPLDLYINGDPSIAYVIGDKMVVDQLIANHPRYKDFSIPHKEEQVICLHCAGSFPVSKTTRFDNVEVVCQQCREALYVGCYRCGRDVLKTSTNILPNVERPFCVSCWRNYTRECFFCHIRSWNSNFRLLPSYIDGLAVDYNYSRNFCCMSCSKIYIGRCRSCHTKTVNMDAEGNPICTSCEEQFEQEITLDRIVIDPITDEIYSLEEFDAASNDPVVVGASYYNSCVCDACTQARLG